MTEPAVRVDSLSISTGDTSVVQRLSFSAKAGEIVSLMGPSGSGKTSTALALMGLLPKHFRSTGTIYLDGTPVPESTDDQWTKLRGNLIAYVAQDAGGWLNPVEKVGHQLHEAIRLHSSTGRSERERQIADALERLNLPRRYLTSYPHQLSGGEKQRLALSMATLNGPKVLIADEPTSALDPQSTAGVIDAVQSIAAGGTSVIFITHNRDVADTLGSRGIELAVGPPSKPESKFDRSVPGEGTVLEVTNLSVAYARHSVLNEISLSVREGETVAVVGPSGAGKTTLGRAVSRLGPADSGTVIIGGTEVTKLKGRALREARSKFQYLHQDSYASLDPRLTVEQIVAEPLLAQGHTRSAETNARVHESLRLTQLDDSNRTRRPGQLSGGQRTRVALARALVTKPPLLILDEPLASLDWDLRDELIELLIQLQRTHTLAYLLITHDPTSVERMSHRILELSNGTLTER